MNFDLPLLLEYLHVDSIGDNLYQGKNIPGKRRAVFGGQIIAQALSAAIKSASDDRFPHSVHCHFLLAGDMSLPIQYQVTPLRDGGSYSLRQVAATQAGKTIFIATVSLQKPESGLQHQQATPVMTPREDMISEFEFWQSIQAERPELTYLRPENFTALEILSRFRPSVFNPKPQEEAKQSFWFKANGTVPSAADNFLLIAFLSDLQFMNTALHAHPYTLTHPDMMAASLDHCLWFYGDLNASEWLYYDMHSPVSSSGRGLNHGYFYTENGDLIVATTQEGMMRVKKQ